MPAKLKVAVLGATGYSGMELTRILIRHPRVDTPLLLRRAEGADQSRASSEEKGGPASKFGNGHLNLADIFPALSGNGTYPLEPLAWSSLKQKGVELLFLATPHEVSRSLVPQAIAEGIRVVDLSGAWRLKQEQHRAIYKFKDEDAATAAELTNKAVYGLPELNAQKFRNGWYHSGDYGFRDQEGNYYFCSRKDDLIIKGGEKIYPAEIENVLSKHPNVAECAVIGVEEPILGQELCAFANLKDQNASTEQELVKFCAQSLARFKQPRRVVVINALGDMPELPKGPTKKILYRKLRDYYENRIARAKDPESLKWVRSTGG